MDGVGVVQRMGKPIGTSSTIFFGGSFLATKGLRVGAPLPPPLPPKRRKKQQTAPVLVVPNGYRRFGRIMPPDCHVLQLQVYCQGSNTLKHHQKHPHLSHRGGEVLTRRKLWWFFPGGTAPALRECQAALGVAGGGERHAFQGKVF